MAGTGWGGIRIGDRGLLDGNYVTLVDRLRFELDTSADRRVRDAWILESSKLDDAWLQDDRQVLTLYRKHRPMRPLSRGSLMGVVPGDIVKLEGIQTSVLTVEEVGQESLVDEDGSPLVSDAQTFRWIEIRSEDEVFAVRISDGGVDVFRGERIAAGVFAAGFNIRAPVESDYGHLDDRVQDVQLQGRLPLGLEAAMSGKRFFRGYRLLPGFRIARIAFPGWLLALLALGALALPWVFRTLAPKF